MGAAKRARGSGSLRSRGGDAWELRYAGATRTFHGKEAEANRALARLVVEIEEGRTVPSRGRTVRTLADAWLELKASDLTPENLADYRRFFDRKFLPELGNIPLAKLTTADIDAFYAKLRRSGLSPATIKRKHSIINPMLNQAVRWGWRATNPAAAANKPVMPDVKIEPPDPAIIVRLLDHVRQKDEAIYAFLILAADTGARLGQLCALRWSDLNAEAATLSITRTVGAQGGIRPLSKTKGRARVLPLGRGTVLTLSVHQHQAKETALAFGARLAKQAHMFSDDPASRTPWKVDTFKHRYLRLRRQVGATDVKKLGEALAAARASHDTEKARQIGKQLDEARRIQETAAATNFHQLRHYVATQLIAAGVDPRTVADRLGHSRTSTTLDMYTAPVSEMGRAAADLLEKVIGEARRNIT